MRPFPVRAASVYSAAALAVLGGWSLPVAAAPAASPSILSPTPGATGLLAKGTVVRVRLATPLRSGQCRDGDPVAFTVVQDVLGPGGVRLLAAGAAGVGRVTDSAGHHSFGRPGRLAFTCDSVDGGGGLRVPLTLSVRPAPPGSTAPAPPVTNFPPQNDLHTPSPVAGDLLAGTPLALGGQSTRSTSGSFPLGGGADVMADTGEEYTASVAADTVLPLLPAPPPVVTFPAPDASALPPGAVKITAANMDTTVPGAGQGGALLRSLIAGRLRAGFSVSKMPNGTIVMTPPSGSMDAPLTVTIPH